MNRLALYRSAFRWRAATFIFLLQRYATECVA